jgi:preprotein translocase subunit SecD
MDRNWYTRLALILAVTFGTIWLLIPTYYSLFVVERADRNNLKKLEEVMPRFAPPARYRLSLGLDLQGGIHLIMRVDVKTALGKRAERRAAQMASWVENKKLGAVEYSADRETLKVTLTAKDPTTMDAIEKEVSSNFTDFVKESRVGGVLNLKLDSTALDGMSEETLDQALLSIRERIDKWGVAEVQISKLGTDQIQVSLPGQNDPEQVKELIGTTAQLEFRIVSDDRQMFKNVFEANAPSAESGIVLKTAGDESDSPPPPFLQAESRQALIDYLKGKIPEGKYAFTHCKLAPGPKRKCLAYQTYLLEKDTVPGEMLRNAYFPAAPDPQGRYYVGFELQPEGAKLMEELTGKNVQRQMAIVLDDNVMSAPTLQSKISDSGQISFSRSQNQDIREYGKLLATTLRAGALPAPVSIGEIRQVGASLGDELIKKGTLAAVVGLLLVVLFMAVYYRISGLVADVALILNGALILAGLALFGATLTLPGIAGFVLTLGIAVDANVLINERVREELSMGKSARAAVDQGYDRAFWTIFDAHVTTLIAGFILMFTGTGPVQGFATSLIIGIIASLFTSIVVTRLITTYVVHGRNADTVSV